MTHIFYIHSNITYLAALSIIQLKGITNPVLIFGRNYKCKYIENQFKKIYLDVEVDSLNNVPSSGERFLIFKKWRALKKFNAIIDQNTQGSFTCYLPHAKIFLMQLFVMHKKCIEYNILDEGMLCYTSLSRIIKQTDKIYEKNWYYKFIRFIKIINHYGSSSVYYPIKTTFGNRFLFYKPFAFDNQTVEVKLPIINIEIPDLSNGKIFILDNLNSDSFINTDNNIQILSKIFPLFSHKSLFVKFHPASKYSEEVIQLLKINSVDYEILDVDIPLELVFAKSTKLEVYGVFSSLLFYASIFGHKSYSHINNAKEVDDKVAIMLDKIMPPIFFEKVELL